MYNTLSHTTELNFIINNYKTDTYIKKTKARIIQNNKLLLRRKYLKISTYYI